MLELPQTSAIGDTAEAPHELLLAPERCSVHILQMTEKLEAHSELAVQRVGVVAHDVEAVAMGRAIGARRSFLAASADENRHGMAPRNSARAGRLTRIDPEHREGREQQLHVAISTPGPTRTDDIRLRRPTRTLEIPEKASPHDSAVTTIVAALRSIEAGEPEALRRASEALAMALAALMAAAPSRVGSPR